MEIGIAQVLSFLGIAACLIGAYSRINIDKTEEGSVFLWYGRKSRKKIILWHG